VPAQINGHAVGLLEVEGLQDALLLNVYSIKLGSRENVEE